VSKFVDRMVGRNDPERRGEIVEAGGESDSGGVGSPTVSRLADYTAHEGDPKKLPPGAVPRMPDAVEEPEPLMDYRKLGEHVTSVLEAANNAAAKIREDARTNAERVTEQSQSEATALLEEARRQAEKLSRESARLSAEAEKENRELARQAEAYAAGKRHHSFSSTTRGGRAHESCPGASYRVGQGRRFERGAPGPTREWPAEPCRTARGACSARA
jgi:hypothetical protein